MPGKCILAIDQGTSSSRAIVFDAAGLPVAIAQEEIELRYPADGWVELDPGELWRKTLAVAQRAFSEAEARGSRVAGIGITNQRETTLVWDRRSGEPIYNAIVWQDRRTSAECHRLRDDGLEPEVRRLTGLLVDPYFSATKIAWILDHVEGARGRAERGELAFGTVDTYLIWRLTGGSSHATDTTNASRTCLFDIQRLGWDPELLRIFDVPRALLPGVRDCSARFGETMPSHFGRALPIAGVAGDQQAAAIGQCCFAPGDIKSTYGTGCFVLLNTGATRVASQHRLLATIACTIAGKTTYALEGSIFAAGAAVQWLRDGLKIIGTATEAEGLARGLDSNRGVYFVPAFTGLGAPHWDAEARGAIFGLTRDTGVADIVRATLESVAYQTSDLLAAMADDGAKPQALRVDGGMVRNDWLMQFLADILQIPVDRPVVHETTALGAANLAGLGLGLHGSLREIAAHWGCERRFEPRMAGGTRDLLLQGWEQAIARVRSRS